MITRRIVLGVTASPAAAPLLAQAQPALSLADRRAIAACQQDNYPAIEAGIQQVAGFPMLVGVEWGRFTVPGMAANRARDDLYGKTTFEAWTAALRSITAALRSITADRMGTDALNARLKKIHIRCDAATAPASNDANGVKFQEGVLAIDCQPFTNAGHVERHTDATTKLLENNL